MGYVPPPVPSFVITHPRALTPTEMERIRAHWFSNMGVLRPIDGGYRQYVRDLYGEPPRDWLPALSGLLLALIVVFVCVLLWAAA